MKIEIDLTDILYDDDYGSETLQESIRRQVIDKLTRESKEKMTAKVDEAVNQIINTHINDALKDKLPGLIDNLIDTEYQVVDRYGRRDSTPTTVRNEIIKTLQEQIVYKPANNNYDKNAFTRSMDDVVQNMMSDFKKQFDAKVNETFTTEAFKYAIEKMNQTLKLTK